MKKRQQLSSSQELKRFQSLHHQLQLELKALHESGTRLKMEIETKEKQIKEIEEKIHKLKGTDAHIIVSEHAIIRYLERVYRLDLEKIKQEILPERIAVQAKVIGNGRYWVIDHTLLIKDNVVVTVLTDDAA
ncbi:hypothetical protein [Sulfuricurvum sp.]|uniref:hypothetical protein n=1 Tax=Sulfuricurvum sp. TaxID=2025608 RepID=UPI002D28E7E5|nr:hypothetical protein [Sulfuricurvum sp.]HZF69394.1 hypothetical protein [Sulfuricurvum sp.]